MSKDYQAQRQRDSLIVCYREMLALLETHYERTGDLALKEIIERAKGALTR